MFGLNQKEDVQQNENVKNAKGEPFFRQGDLWFDRLSKEEAESIKKKAVPVNGNIVAYGEATGHHHKAIGGQVQLLTTESNIAEPNLLLVEQETQLVHEEHPTVNIDEGVFAIVREREMDVFRNINRVQD